MLIQIMDYREMSSKQLKEYNKMKQKIKDLFRKAYNKLFRKFSCGTYLNADRKIYTFYDRELNEIISAEKKPCR